MKAAPILLLLITFFGFPQDPTANKPISLDEEFTIKYRERVTIEGEKLTLKFSSVYEDSRCPTTARCIWAGNGAIVVQVHRKWKKVAQATLNTLYGPNEIEYKGYVIRLVALNPYPITLEPIDPSEYEAVLTVSKEQ